MQLDGNIFCKVEFLINIVCTHPAFSRVSHIYLERSGRAAKPIGCSHFDIVNSYICGLRQTHKLQAVGIKCQSIRKTFIVFHSRIVLQLVHICICELSDLIDKESLSAGLYISNVLCLRQFIRHC